MRREIFKDMFDKKTSDRVLTDFGGCPLSSADKTLVERVTEFLGYDYGEKTPDGMLTRHRMPEKLLQHYDIDTRAVGDILMPKKSHFRQLSDTAYIDEWGVTRAFSGLYWDITDSPLKDKSYEEILRFPFPDPESVDLNEIDAMATHAKYLYENTDYIICASHPVFGIFELACWMFGFDDFLCRMLAEPETVEMFFRRVLEYQLKINEIYYGKLGKYIHLTSSGDDFATQQSSFFSKELFDTLVIPYFKERISDTKRYTDAKFLHHSCGNVFSFIPSLIKAGVDILNPIQPCSPDMNPANLVKNYKDQIVFHGGFDTQSILPRNNPEEIAAETEKLIRAFKGKSGYIFAAAHNLQADVSVESVNALFETAKKFK